MKMLTAWFLLGIFTLLSVQTHDGVCLPAASQFSFANVPASSPVGSTFLVQVVVLDPAGFSTDTYSSTLYAGWVNVSCSGSAVCPTSIFFEFSMANFTVYNSVAEVVSIQLLDLFPTNFDMPPVTTLTFFYGPWTTVMFSQTPAASQAPGKYATVTLLAQDDYGNTLPDANGPVGISITGGGVASMIPASTVQFIAGQASIQVFSSVVGTFNISISNTLPIAGLTKLPRPGSVKFTGNGTRIIQTYSSTSSSCDNFLTVTLTLLDSGGREVLWQDTAVDVFLSGSAVFVDTTLNQQTIQLDGGRATVLVQDRVAQSVLVTILDSQLTGLQMPPSQLVKFVAGTASTFNILDPYANNAGPFTVGKAVSITVQVLDWWGNVANISGSATLQIQSSSAVSMSRGSSRIFNINYGVSAPFTLTSSVAQRAVISIFDSSRFGIFNSSMSLWWVGSTCTHFRVLQPAAAQNLRAMVNVTVQCTVNTTAPYTVDTTWSGEYIGLTSNSPFLTPVMPCKFYFGQCWAVFKATRSGTYTVTPVHAHGTGSITPAITLVSGTVTVVQTDPIIYSTSLDGCSTAGNCTYKIKGVALYDPGNPACTGTGAPTVDFVDDTTSITTSCVVTKYNGSEVTCTVPAGQGQPEVVITVCGTRQAHLPRWPNDVFFWQGTNVPGQEIYPWCVNLNNQLDQWTHTWLVTCRAFCCRS
jgi:hypothetical protein